jgi:periplasmic copper chaperone A
MNHSYAALFVLSLLGVASSAFAQEFKGGDIVIEKAFARATPKGAEVGGAYFTVRNDGATPDRLTGGTADFANVEIHQAKTEDGVMKMSPLPNGLNLPAHSTVRLAPGGYHVMLTQLKKPLEKGKTFTATMIFDKAGPIVVEFPIEGIGAMSGGMSGAKGGDMKGHDMKGQDMKDMGDMKM